MCRQMFYLSCLVLLLALAGSTNAGLADKGTILFEWFNGTTGSDLNQVVDGRNRNYPDNPSQVEYRTVLQGPTSRGDNYVTHVRGYLYPPTTGDYTFWTSSDDHSRLWLSTDADPANKKLIAEVVGYTGALQWDKFPSQKSAPITLQAGQKYYIEVLHRDGTGGDNLAVAWGGPAPIGAGPVVIDGQYLSPFIRAVDYLASTPDPANGAIYMDTWATLTWTVGFAAVSHDVYFSSDSNAVTTGAAGAFAGNQPANLLLIGLGMPGDPYPTGLVPGSTYYWRVDEVEADGTTKHKGPTWNFFVPPKEAYQPNPADGAKYQDKATALSWSSGLKAKLHVVYFGDSLDVVNNATTGGTSSATIGYTPAGPLADGKTYYWRVDEVDPPATTKGNVWSFTTIPAIAVADPNLVGWWKLDEAEGTRVVDWSGYGNHGTFAGAPQWVDGQDGGAVQLDGVDDYVNCGNGAPLNITSRITLSAWVKTNDAGNSQHNEWLGKGDHTYAIKHSSGNSLQFFIYQGGWHSANYAIGSSFNGIWHHVAGTYDGVELRLYLDGTLVTTLPYAGAIETRSHVVTMGNNSEAAGRFFQGAIDDARIYNKALTAEELLVVMRGDPIRAGNPSPANGLPSDVERASTLSWLPGTGAAQHAVYFGADKAAVADANAADTTGVYRGLQAAASYTLPEALAWASGPYYWRVDEQGADGTVVKGSLWSFSVPDYIVVDNFEAYNDLPDGQVGSKLIYVTWKDGFANPAANGATIGYTTVPSVQTATVHSGRQAAPLAYNNATAPLSEAELTFAPQNWTTHGVLTLSLWFYGDPNNVAGQLYVKINNTKVLYGGDAADLKIAVWMPWTIDLASTGADLQSVTTLAIGIDGAGAAGKLLIDDICLFPSVGQTVAPADPGTAGLVAYYKFDGDAQDSAGTHHATPSGSPGYAAGKVGQALNVSADLQYVTTPYAADLSMNTFTIAAWVNLADKNGNRGIIGTRFSGDNTFDLKVDAVRIHGDIGDGTAWLNTAADVVTAKGGSLTVGQWYHIAYVIDDATDTAKLYVNGALATTITFAGTPLFMKSGQEMRIGVCYGSEYMRGAIDEVRIYNRALSEAETAALAGRPGPVYKPL